MARTEEWDAMSGARLTASASANVLSDTCEMSTRMPCRLSSRITSLPKSVRPLWAGVSVEESAHSSL